MPSFTTHSEAETMRIATDLARTLRGGEVVLLSGDLGAGKTVFVRGLARGLGVRGRITSPTFVVMRVYRAASAPTSPRLRGARKLQAASRRRPRCSKCRQLEACSCRAPSNDWGQLVARFVHVDAYRIRDARELEAIGLLEWVGRPDTIVVIEWGERVAAILRPVPCRRVVFTSQRDDRRRIEIT